VLEELMHETGGQSQLSLDGKRAFGSKGHDWTLAYRPKRYPHCDGLITTGPTGVLQRKSRWCKACAVYCK
jgi:hypothetical protein